MRSSIYIVFVFSFLQACNTNVSYSEYQHISNEKWKLSKQIEFTIPIKDTLSLHNLYINLRTNKDYPYSNLFLITQMSFPDNTKVTDTLEYEMTDANGRFLGSGFSDVKENKLFYKEKVRFKDVGDYHFSVRHAMRKRDEITGIQYLNGVLDVGISVEKLTE